MRDVFDKKKLLSSYNLYFYQITLKKNRVLKAKAKYKQTIKTALKDVNTYIQ
jgi:hypothetical protein